MVIIFQDTLCVYQTLSLNWEKNSSSVIEAASVFAGFTAVNLFSSSSLSVFMVT